MLAVLSLTLSASSAVGGPDGRWTRVTDNGLGNIDQVALARDAGGVLNVVWPLKTGGTVAFRAARIARNGATIGVPATVTDGWRSVNNSALVVQPDGSLRLLFAGIHASQPSFSVGRATSATAPADGSSWTWTSQFHTDAVGVSEYAGSFGAATALDGTPVFSWGAHVKVGLDPAVPDQLLVDGCCTYDSDVAVDGATGEVLVVWYSNIAANYGTWARVVSPALGALVHAPGSARVDLKAAIPNSQRVAVTGRIGAPGIYLAYGSGYGTVVPTVANWRPGAQRILFWQYGGVDTPRVLTNRRGTRVMLSPGPNAKIWVAWVGKKNVIQAMRSSSDLRRFGALVTVSPPAGTSTLWKLAGDGAAGPLDVVAIVKTPSGTAGWHRQLLPGLTVLPQGRAPGVAFIVTDAGEPVAGATVTVAGRTARTGATGVTRRFDLPASREYRVARAAKPGYTDGTILFR